MLVSADHNLWFIFVSNTVYWIPSVLCTPCACGYNSVLANRKTGSVKRIPPECFRKDSHAIHKRGGNYRKKPKEMIFSSVRNNRPICLFSYDSLPMAFSMAPFLCLLSYGSFPLLVREITADTGNKKEGGTWREQKGANCMPALWKITKRFLILIPSPDLILRRILRIRWDALRILRRFWYPEASDTRKLLILRGLWYSDAYDTQALLIPRLSSDIRLWYLEATRKAHRLTIYWKAFCRVIRATRGLLCDSS